MAINAVRVPGSGGFVATENTSAADETFPASSPAVIQASEDDPAGAFPLPGTGGYIATASGSGTASDPWVPAVAVAGSGGQIIEVQNTAGDGTGDVTFTNPAADIYYAVLTGIDDFANATLPSPGSPRVARIVADGSAVAVNIAGIDFTNATPNLVASVSNQVCIADLVFNADNVWVVPENDGVAFNT